MMAACAVLFSAAWLGLSHTTQAQGLPAKGGSTDAPQCDPYWQVVSTASAVNGGTLTGISVISASDIWAVGYYSGKGGYKTLTMHWDGVSWSLKNGSNGSTQNNYLYGVKAIAANDVWAVGTFHVSSGASHTLIIHWTGSYWATVPSPDGGMYRNTLTSVTALSGNSVWAVGHYIDQVDNSRYQTLTMHWNGSLWTTVGSPNPSQQGGNFLYGVTVAGVAHSDLWAVGCYQYNTGFNLCGRTLILRWNAVLQQWDVIPSPNPGSGERYLYGITAVSANELWAVGTYGPNGVGKMTLTLHYINNTWSYVGSPNPYGSSGSYLRAVSAVAANDVWAVGESTSSGTKQTFIEHWNGSDWAYFLTPNVGTDHNQLYGVAAVSATDVWSVGFLGGYPSFDYQTLAERFNPCN